MEMKVGISPLGHFNEDKWKNIIKHSLGIDASVVKLSPRKIQDLDFLIFDGGADVNPRYYGSLAHYSTRFFNERDQVELNLFNVYKNLSTKFIGICRGHQFLNVASGGTLIQDLNSIGLRHSNFHKVETVKKTKMREYFNFYDEFDVNSYHHQAVLALGNNLMPTLYDSNTDIIEGIESQEGDKIRSVQCHPEMGGFEDSRTLMKYLFRRT